MNIECFAMYHAILEVAMQTYEQCHAEKKLEKQRKAQKDSGAIIKDAPLNQKSRSCASLFHWRIPQGADKRLKPLYKPRSKL
jgi:hypothetical protein